MKKKEAVSVTREDTEVKKTAMLIAAAIMLMLAGAILAVGFIAFLVWMGVL